MSTGTAGNDDQTATIAFLADPATHGGHAVACFETHGAFVFAAGDRAVKLKRAVRYPYMDFSTLEKRRQACRAEIALNRRTAPTLYLGIAAIVPAADGGLVLGPLQENVDAEPAGTDRALEWVVVMRRFDDENLFDRLARRGDLSIETMDALAEAVAALHGRAERVTDPRYGAAGLEAVLAENAAEFRDDPAVFPPERAARLEEAAQAWLGRLAPLLDRRTAAGMVRRCHGDLHLRNVVMLDGRPTLFDCIEFNDDFAIIDVLYDLAFLLMDLDHRGLRGHANRVLNRWLEISRDDEGLAALPLFLSSRAAIRAKVAATIARTLAAEDDADGAAAQRGEARGYLDMALGYLTPPAARLIGIGGLSGTGKTTVARALAPEIGRAPGAVILRSDVIRKAQFGVPPTETLPKAAYATRVSARVYREINERVATLLAGGQAVIADAVFAKPAQRTALAAIAQQAGVPFRGLWLTAARPVLEARVADRTGDASDAGPAVVAMQSTLDPGPLDWVTVDAGDDPGAVADRARRWTTGDRDQSAALRACGRDEMGGCGGEAGRPGPEAID
ncbi:MAG: AAA family ATPase [Alphaproteobacteria bacterium]|nr:AAA family ATPase [Alphaproteobacteria bacterium]